MENYLGSKACTCGREHDIAIDDVVVGKGVLARLPEFAAKYGAKKPFILADCNTFKAAGEQVAAILDRHGIAHGQYVFPSEHLEPDEQAVGSAVMHFDTSCDLIIGVGSGVINDIGKILSSVTGRKYIIVGTAPSMDGYASATSSMSMDGLKVSLPSRCADVIIGDIDILKNAPEHMLKAGLGDMLAKYVSIAEWRIAHLITGEYYCERVAQLIRAALKKCVDNADGLLKRDEAAVQAVFEGLVIGGVAMAYAGVSRPASGVEHYFSHVWDMRGLEFGTRVDLHGIQCAMATQKAVELYEAVKQMKPDKEKAFAAVAAFDLEEWNTELRTFLGNSGETMIAQEQKERKYDKSTHPARFEIIANNWQTILAILNEELPAAEKLGNVMDAIGISRDLNDLGVDRECARMTFKATKDIRDKYVLSRLAWDLGVLDELCERL
ncbi:MAG: sn-glycerol-1-phosphate dehydrogenase [Oscillospiraceae bacterium]|nr:sn-glycerol-1-phosphate dehydrogenase [Oscillospiraceae bacterium]MBQ7089320.1 sn-glycerol-1-phosphate dehydrogenase [Clostridia bacterium]